jgi:hypothetical protein
MPIKPISNKIQVFGKNNEEYGIFFGQGHG